MLLHFDHSHLSMPKSRLVSKKSISPPSAHEKNGIFVLKHKITTMKRLTLLFSALLLSLVAVAQPSVTSLRVDRMSAPVGIDSRQPLLSWIIESPTRSTTQSAYEISVYEGQRRIWNTGKVLSDTSTGVRYEGPALKSGTRYTWQVRVWDNHDKASRWSARSSWLTGLLSPDEWLARWIEPTQQGTESPLLRREFTLRKPIASAVAYVTAHGMYEAEINGAKVGNAEYAPGWTSYNSRLQYQTYDITSMLRVGKNAIGIELGRGWYHSVLGWAADSGRTVYNIKKLGALAQVVVTYKDGTQEIITTDSEWRSTTGPILLSTIYDGETVDARLAKSGWSRPEFDSSSWPKVAIADYPLSDLVAIESEPVVIHQRIKPVKVITTPAGEKVLDFGQNLVGREVVTYKGKPGQKIVISHAEVLDEKGNFYTVNLRSAKAQSTYICSGEEDHFEPKFTFYGFRYLRVEGIEGELNPDNFEAAVIFSNIAENGNFSSSNELVNQLQSNIQWGLTGNFLDVPTDCPQRDERLGWTGDAQVFFRTATFNRDVQNFFRKWLKDLALDQHKDGRVSDIVPNLPGLVGYGRVGWADAATIIPWQHYMAYGDRSILEDQYASMKAWVDHVITESNDYLWNSGWHYGDWLFYSVNNDNAGNSAVTYTPLVQQCFFANSASIMARTAEILGRTDDARYYADVAAKAREAFCENYLTPAGMLVSSTQTAYVLALNFDMLPENMRAKAAAHLAANVEKYGHITTGFLGTPYICHVLTEFGYNDLAYKLLLRDQYPGWLYPVTMGATTIWERWNSMMPDRTIPDNGMNSFNHYSYGAIGDWLYRDAVGLHEGSAGFKTIIVKPHPGADFTQMQASQLTPYGRAEAEWQKRDGEFSLRVVIPANTTAEIYVPSASADSVTLDGKAINASPDAIVVCHADGYTRIAIGSGNYLFETK